MLSKNRAPIHTNCVLIFIEQKLPILNQNRATIFATLHPSVLRQFSTPIFSKNDLNLGFMIKLKNIFYYIILLNEELMNLIYNMDQIHQL